MSYDEAVKHIDKWYRYGDRVICVPSDIYFAYVGGLIYTDRFSDFEPPYDKFGRWFIAYKAARVYTN